MRDRQSGHQCTRVVSRCSEKGKKSLRMTWHRRRGGLGLETSPEGKEDWTGRGRCRGRSLPWSLGKGRGQRARGQRGQRVAVACLGILLGYMFPPQSQANAAAMGTSGDTGGSAASSLPSPCPISWVAWNQGEAGGSVAARGSDCVRCRGVGVRTRLYPLASWRKSLLDIVSGCLSLCIHRPP